MKKLTFLFTLALLIVGVTGVKAETVNTTIDGLNYQLDTDTKKATVAPTTGVSGELVIPATVTYNTVQYEVTEIAQDAFQQNKGITSVIIGDNVTHINQAAFFYCENITSVTLGEKVQEIGHSAFRYSKISSIVIPNSVTTIRNMAFHACHQLTTITIGSGVTWIGYDTFESCDAVTDVYCYTNPKLLNWSTNSADQCFKDSKATICHVYDAAGWRSRFSDLNLTYDEMAPYVDDNGVVYLFNAGNESLFVNWSLTATGDIVIPNTVTIGNTEYPVTNIAPKAFYSSDAITSVSIGDNVTTIGEYAFYYCNKLGIVTLGKGLTLIDEDAFYYCNKVTDVYCYANSASLTWKDEDSNDFKNSKYTNCHVVNLPLWDEFSHVNVTFVGDIPSYSANNINYILNGNKAYVGSSPDASGNVSILNKITVGETDYNVTAIGKQAFLHCEDLRTVTLPDNVTTLAQEAFGLSGISSINLNQVTTIEPYAFARCGNLTSIDLTNVSSLGTSAFANSGLTSVTIPSGITSIPERAFAQCVDLAAITFHDDVTSIGESAFAYCASLTSVNLNKVSTIGEYAFEYSGLTSVSFPASNTNIGEMAFDHCADLATVDFSNVTVIGTQAFFECTTLDHVTLPSCVSSIGEGAFTNCSSLADLSMASTITSIPMGAFSGCGFTTLVIPNSITTIGAQAYASCESLTTVTIPASVTSIGAGAFTRCSSVKDVTCNADPDELTWSVMSLPPGIPDEYIEQFKAWYSDFMPNKATLCHVADASAWRIEKFADVNVTFIDNNNILYLENGEKNSSLIAAQATEGNNFNVRLNGRSLVKNGLWNTLCLPFSLTSEQLSANDCPLKGATVKTLESASFNESTGALTLTFSDDLTEIEAGKPYIVKWESGDPVVNPVFNNVTLVSGTPTTTPASGVATFQGSYDPISIPEGGDNTLLYLSTYQEDEVTKTGIYYPSGAMTIGAQRAVFHLDGITAGSITAGARLFFGDDDATGINDNGIMINDHEAGAWYTIDGLKLSGKPTRKGLYIHNNRVFNIK